MVDSFYGRQRCPGKQLGDIFDFGVRFQHDHHVLGDHEVDVDHRLALLLLDLTFLVLYFYQYFLFLLAWKHSAVAV